MQCLSESGQVHIAYMMYAQLNHDQIPLGFAQHVQYNYVIWDGFYSTPGVYLIHRAVVPGRADQIAAGFLLPGTGSSGFFIQHDDQPLAARPGGFRYAYRLWCVSVCAADWSISNPPAPMPRLTKMKNMALFSDLASMPYMIMTGHKTGVNVLYANGSAVWIPLSIFKNDLWQCRQPGWQPYRHHIQHELQQFYIDGTGRL